MAKSLQDQLLNAGLVNNKQAKQVRVDQRRSRKRQQKTGAAGQEEGKRHARAQQAEKAERDARLNREREEAAARKAIAAQVRQMVKANRLPRDDADEAYNFTDGNTVRKIYVTAAMRRQIIAGRLAIVKLDADCEVVPAEIARRIRQRSQESVLVLLDRTEDENAADENKGDDPYAAFTVPDDLNW